MSKRIIDPAQIATRDLHQYLIGLVAPRPIAFVSTVNEQGQPNLAPYSFFNAFSSNPPIVVFSSNRRVTDNTTKDTLANIRATRQLVINMVNYQIVNQMTIASVEYTPEINEFEKAGLSAVPAQQVNAHLVAESPASLECVVKDIITLGKHGGAGHLIICEVVMLHIREDVITDNNRIDPHKLDLMGRMGRAYYVRASGKSIHTIFQAVTGQAIGFDNLPSHLLRSQVLTGNELGKLAGQSELPSLEEAKSLVLLPAGTSVDDCHQMIKELIQQNELKKAAAMGVVFSTIAERPSKK